MYVMLAQITPISYHTEGLVKKSDEHCIYYLSQSKLCNRYQESLMKTLSQASCHFISHAISIIYLTPNLVGFIPAQFVLNVGIFQILTNRCHT